MSPSLKLLDLHPSLQAIFNIGCEIEQTLSVNIKKDGAERTALNLTHKREEITTDEVAYQRSSRNMFGDVVQIPVYKVKREHRWRVNFGVEKQGRFTSGLSHVLGEVNDEPAGVTHLQRIASELQQIYGLPYTPAVYVAGKKRDSYH